MTKPRLLIISFSDISADARVLKQISLFSERYAVTTFGYGPQPHTAVEHIRLDDAHGIRRWRRHDLILRRFRRIYWEQPAVRQGLVELSARPRFDAVIANDIDAVGLALALEPRSGVHADIHEYAPKQNEEILVWRIFIAPYVTWMCREFLPHTSSMTTVGQGLAAEYRRVFGLHADVVTNATPYADLVPGTVSSPIRLVHSGASLRNRRIEVLIDAVIATTSDVTLDIYLMGNDPAYIRELRARAERSSRVRVLDPFPYRELVRGLNRYDVGIHVIAPTNFNNKWSLANKFFDYVQARLGLIIGPSPEMKALLEKYRLGAVADDFSADSLTRVLDTLSDQEVQAWKQNSAAAAHELSSETQVQVWDRAIERLLKG